MLCQRIIFDRGPGEILGFIIGAIVQCFIEKFSIKKTPKSSSLLRRNPKIHKDLSRPMYG